MDTPKAESLYNGRAKAESRVSRNDIFKRVIDIFGALVGLLISSPVFLMIALVIKLTDPKGPVFFKQKRVGYKQKMFQIFKFRTMIFNAEEHLKKDKKMYEKYLKNNYKLEPDEDPRITKIGRFLRKTSLDELPQFVNVLKGQMSLVGPRPVVIEELEEYGELKMDLLSVKPGVTGYWQTCGRSEIGYPERVDVELYYVYNKSTLLDIKILFKTIKSVFLKRGAY